MCTDAILIEFESEQKEYNLIRQELSFLIVIIDIEECIHRMHCLVLFEWVRVFWCVFTLETDFERILNWFWVTKTTTWRKKYRFSWFRVLFFFLRPPNEKKERNNTQKIDENGYGLFNLTVVAQRIRFLPAISISFLVSWSVFTIKKRCKRIVRGCRTVCFYASPKRSDPKVAFFCFSTWYYKQQQNTIIIWCDAAKT